MDANQQIQERRNKICPGPDMSRSPREHGAEDDIVLVVTPDVAHIAINTVLLKKKVLIFLFWLWYVSSFFFETADEKLVKNCLSYQLYIVFLLIYTIYSHI